MFDDYRDAAADAVPFDGRDLPNTALNDASWKALWTTAVAERLQAYIHGAADSGVVYLPRDDILRVRLSNKPVARDGSPEKHIHIACAADGSVVEVILLHAHSQRWLRPHMKQRPVGRRPGRTT
jgi:hypothetical protein